MDVEKALIHILTETLIEQDEQIEDLQATLNKLTDFLRDEYHKYIWRCFVCDETMIVEYGDDTWFACPNCPEPIHICHTCQDNQERIDKWTPTHDVCGLYPEDDSDASDYCDYCECSHCSHFSADSADSDTDSKN